jgi:hypothetical protein
VIKQVRISLHFLCTSGHLHKLDLHAVHSNSIAIANAWAPHVVTIHGGECRLCTTCASHTQVLARSVRKAFFIVVKKSVSFLCF